MNATSPREPVRPDLPVFPGGGVPRPESSQRKLYIRSVAVFALTVTFAYLSWRAAFTIDLDAWWVSVPLFAFEFYAFVSLALFAFTLWDIDVRAEFDSRATKGARIAVLIPTYNEDVEILIPTIAAAVALEPSHETWVLDDGARPAVQELAKSLGAKYLARRDRTGAKAGNLNHALDTIEADFVAVLDADHVAQPDLLEHTLGYFTDPAVAIVQTPQDFYNLESFEHEDRRERTPKEDEPLFHEQTLFYRAIQPGKNRWNAAFWCGTGAVIRTQALAEIGGVATGTMTEDIHTSIRLHRRGWKVVYHNEVLARGLAASSADQYQLQRLRWGTGAMQVLRTENPLFVSGLRPTQRLAYAATLLGWFDAWRSLGYVLLPMAVLITGAIPIRVDPLIFIPAFAATFLLQQWALRVLSRGHHRIVLSIIFDLIRMTPNLLATLSLLRSRKGGFQVTPKGRQESDGARVNPPPLLVTLTALSLLAAAWFVLTMIGRTPTSYVDLPFAYAAVFWLALNLALIMVASGRISSARYGPDRRAAVRFDAGVPGTLDGMPCKVHEISLTGAQVAIAPRGKEGRLDAKRHDLTIEVLGQELSFGVLVHRQQIAAAGGRRVGLEFLQGQWQLQATLALALLNHQAAPLQTSASRRAA